MSTEDVGPRYRDLDMKPAAEQARVLFESLGEGVAAVGGAVPAIGAAAALAAGRLRGGGRLVYAGAGTSARIGVQDGAELLPTFNWPADRVAFAIAGGEAALLRAIENAEDSADSGARRMEELGVGAADVVIGIAASGNTPFTVSAVATAQARGALTIGIANTAGSRLLAVCDHPILIETGAEPVAGSTRLKAGTAQKVALNMISTAVMMQLGRVYQGLMVDMRPTNDKLRRRAQQIVARIAGCTPEQAADALAASGGDIKTAVLVVRGIAVAAAQALIARHEGNLRAVLAEIGHA